MRVFVSSTYLDLKQYRAIVAEAIERLGDSTSRMEIFGARPEEPRSACLREIEQCELFVGIYAHQYGYMPPGHETSITEQEYRHAKSLGKPIFCYLVDEEHPWPPKLIETDPGRTKLSQFKAEIQGAYVRDTFTTPEDLAFRVATAVARHLAFVRPSHNSPPAASRLFSNCNDLSDILDVALGELERITRTDYNQIFLIQPGGYSLKLIAVADAIAQGKQRYRVATLSGLLGEAILKGKTVRVDNVRERPGYFQAVLETRSELVVPVALNRAVVGLFNSEAEVEKHYSAPIVAACEDLAEAFAHVLFRLEWQPGPEQNDLPWIQRLSRQRAT